MSNRLGPRPLWASCARELIKNGTFDGMEATQVIDDLVRRTAGGLNNSANARFYAWVIGGSLPSALAADWLTSTWDQNAGMYTVSPASAVIEETVGRWLKDLFGIPQEASFALVTGCQMANTTCLAAARSWLLKKLDGTWNGRACRVRRKSTSSAASAMPPLTAVFAFSASVMSR